MESVLLSLAVLACPVGMGAMMWLMMRGTRNKSGSPASPEELRAEHARIGEEIERQESSRPAAGARS